MQYLPVLRQGPEAAARSAGSCHHRSSVWSVSPPAEFPAGPLLPAPVHSHDDCSDLVLHAVAHDVRGDLVHHVFHEAVVVQGQPPQAGAVRMLTHSPPSDCYRCV